MNTTTKKLAFAFERGLRLAYGKKIRATKRKLLQDMLDDMALALTHQATTEKEESFIEPAGILGSILDDWDVPMPSSLRSQRRRKKNA